MSTISFNLQEIPHKANEKTKGYYPVVANSRKFSFNQICDSIQQRCTVTSSDIIAVIDALSNVIGEEIAKGSSIDIPKIGRFSPTLKCDNKIANCHDKRIAKHLKVKTIRFCPKKDLLSKSSKTNFKRDRNGTTTSKPLAEHEIMSLLSSYVKTNASAYITRDDIEHITGFRRTKSNLTLKQLTERGLLIKHGITKMPFYTINFNSTEPPSNQ